MFKHIIKLFTALALFIGALAFVAPAAVADSNEQAPKVMIDINVSPSATAELDVKTITTLNTDAKGRVMVGPLQDRQLTLKERKARAVHWLQSDAKRCPIVANQPRTQKQITSIKKTTFVKKGSALKRFKKAAPSAKVTKKLSGGKRKLTVRCYQVKVGGSFTDTGIDPTGNTHGLESKVGDSPQLKRPMLFDTVVATVKEGGKVVTQEISRRRGQNAPGSKVVGVGDCMNPKAKVVTLKRGQYVYSFNNSQLRQHVVGTAHQRLHVSGRGRAELGTCWVEFDYDFLTEGTLGFDEILWAKSKAEAKGKATNLAASINVSRTVQGSLENKLNAELRVAFGEQCKGDTTPTPKGTIEIDRMNDLNQSTIDDQGKLHKSQSPGDIDYMVPDGQQATIRIDCGSCSSVVFASNESKTLTVTGDGKVHTATYTYTASTESGTDTITASNTTAANPVTTDIVINKIVLPPR